jgi:hypothetical protein
MAPACLCEVGQIASLSQNFKLPFLGIELLRHGTSPAIFPILVGGELFDKHLRN